MSDENNKKDLSMNLSTFIERGFGDSKNNFAAKLREHYGSDEYLKMGMGLSTQSYGSKRAGKTISQEINDAKDAAALRKISNESKTHQGYSDIINFYKTMFHYRYTVTPVRMDLSQKPVVIKELQDITYEMLELVESASLEAILPNIIEKGLYDGFVGLYLDKQGKGVATYLLPSDYCSPFLATSYGTTTVVFDLSYFDTLFQTLNGSNDVSLEGKLKAKGSQSGAEATKAQQVAILSLFPKEITTAYKNYKGLDNNLNPIGRTSNQEKSPQFIQLDQKKAALIPFSPSMAPPKIKALAAEERYEDVAEISARKDGAGLEKIFTHQLPLNEDGELAISIPEAEAVQRAMQNLLGGEADIKVITTLGETALLEVQKGLDERNTVVKDAFDSQYIVSGINPEMFRANTDYALSVSIARNSAFIWDILQKIMTFYNLSINQQFKFGNYSCSINLLPINVYNESEQIAAYRSSAAYGIGKLEAVVATGQKQISLYDKLELEAAMELDSRLTPLQSSHTQSSKDVSVETATREDTSAKPEKETKQVKDEVKDD